MNNIGQKLFFWIDRLHISPSERYFVSGLMVVYILLWIADPFIKPKNPYDEAYYAPLMQTFYEHISDRYHSKTELLDRYYPGQTDTISTLARQVIPPVYADQIQSVTERRQRDGEADSYMGLPADDFSIADNGLDARISSRFGLYNSVSETEKIAESISVGVRVDSVNAGNRSTTRGAAVTGRVNINTAGFAELTRLPGIGPAMAERIINYRQENGPFRRVEDIVKVRGIGPARLEQLRELIEV
jgi:comEA protein